jgi:hypothetical protein
MKMLKYTLTISEKDLDKKIKLFIFKAISAFFDKEIKIDCYGLNSFPAICDVGTYNVTQCNTQKKGFQDTSEYFNFIKDKVSKSFAIKTFFWDTSIIYNDENLKKYMINNKSFQLFQPHKSKKTVFTGFKATFKFKENDKTR